MITTLQDAIRKFKLKFEEEKNNNHTLKKEIKYNLNIST